MADMERNHRPAWAEYASYKHFTTNKHVFRHGFTREVTSNVVRGDTGHFLNLRRKKRLR